ncbi:MAG TPA: zinc-binding alcohol dehydrogenase [Aliidongia sp.]|uniref:zinc-dependent alcohol dehydrogenase n=1 Tax=Aliidongia sp. TaxID=1914230 RepID=UPI002DDCBE06|nr:zinc-binding alcohol dehydrogenase [Aliidongia sp.]HEV2675320.1 zinc-binding alcohol dehydrogenase [Aliidongia sp.]
MSDVARAFWVAAPGQGEIRSMPLAEPGSGEIRVRMLASGISRGTEALVFRGGVPASQHQAMRCPFQDGDFPGPVKYGYSAVGLVEAGPDTLVGRRVFCLYPHQDRFNLPAVAAIAIPDAVPTRRAVLAANLETALNGLWDGAAMPGSRIAVIGAGVVGGLVATVATRLPGAEVTLVDRDPARRALAEALGCRFALPDAAPADQDLVIQASGTPAGLALALRLAGLEATVLDMSWYGDQPVTLPLGEAFHAKRLTIRASQVGMVAPAQRPRWTHRRRLALALDLLTDPVYDHFLDGDSAFADLPETMARLANDGAGALCRVVVYP